MSLPAAVTTDPKTQEGTLLRGLGTIDATMIVMGSMIGSGIFITSAESARLRRRAGMAAGGLGLGGPDDRLRRDLPRPRSPP